MFVSLGAMLCGDVVVSSTVEETYRVANGQEARMIWLQKTQRVNDQSFESFAVFVGASQEAITTSVRTDIRARPSSLVDRSIVAALVKLKSASSWVSRLLLQPQPSHHRNSSQAAAAVQVDVVWADVASAKVVTGVLLAVSGYLIQVTGQRGLHFSATLAQVGAMLVGVFFRTILSRDLAKPLACQRLPDGFELDWLATTMGKLPEAPWLAPIASSSAPSTNTAAAAAIEWSIVTGNDRSRCFALEESIVKPVPSSAQSIMKIRRQLGKLADWKSPASDQALSLAHAIEVVMNALFSSRSDYPRDELTWTLDAYHDGSATGQPVQISIKRERRHGKWRVAVDDLDAALSLWLCTAQELRGEDGPVPGEVDERGDAWLRSKGSMPRASIRLLGPRTDQLHRDLAWWLPFGVDGITSLKTLGAAGQGVSNHAPATLQARNEMIVGHGSQGHDDAIRRRGRTDYLSLELPPPCYDDSARAVGASAAVAVAAATSDHILATVHNDPLEAVYAQDLFSTFMWSAAKYLKSRIRGGVDIRRSDGVRLVAVDEGGDRGWRAFSLKNTTLSRMMQDVQRTGLGNLTQVSECIIPPLSMEKKLPVPEGVVELARQHAWEHQQLRRWKQAGNVYSWLLRVAGTFDKGDAMAYTAVAAATEFCRTLEEALRFKESQRLQQRDAEIAVMDAVKASIEAEMQLIDSVVLRRVAGLYHFQNRTPPAVLGNEMEDEVGALSNGGVAEVHGLVREVQKNQEPLAKYLETGQGRETINTRDALQWTGLHYAASQQYPTNGRVDVQNRIWARLLNGVRALLRTGSDVNAKDAVGWTPLHYASRCRTDKNGGMVNIFISARASLNVQGLDGLTPLHCAATGGSETVVKALVEAGAETNVPDGWGNTPLRLAIIHGHEDVVDYLWCRTNVLRRDRGGRTVLHLMAANGRAKMLRRVRENGYEDLKDSINHRDGSAASALCLAVFGNHTDAVRELLALGADKNSWDAGTATDGKTRYLNDVADKVMGNEEMAKLFSKELKALQTQVGT